jgi:hypothetical protein
MQEVGNLRWNRLVQKAAIHLPKMITDANPYGTSNSTFGIISPLVHSEKDFASRKLDEGRMAHPPSGCPVPDANCGRLKIVPSNFGYQSLRQTPTTKLPSY